MDNNIKPITPQDAATSLPENSNIPKEMIFVVNEILKEKYTTGKSVDITVEDIKVGWNKLENPPELLNNYLNFEPHYIKAGWSCKWIKESNAYESGYDRYEFTSK